MLTAAKTSLKICTYVTEHMHFCVEASCYAAVTYEYEHLQHCRNHPSLPCVLSSPAWLSFQPGGRCPSSAPPGTSCLPEDCPCHPSPPRARLWSLASSAPLNGRSCCCSLQAGSGWKHLCRKELEVSSKRLNLTSSYSNTIRLYLAFVSGAGLLRATLGEGGSSGMADGGTVAEEAEEAPKAEGAVCNLSNFSDLSDLEERFMRFKNPPLLFFFSAS